MVATLPSANPTVAVTSSPMPVFAEIAATADVFDTVQFVATEKGAWRIKTYATDQDVHVWSIGGTPEGIVELARTNTEGTPVSTLLDSGFPRLHFSRKGNVELALRNFSATRLLGIIEQLATAALEMRKQSTLAALIAQRALLAIAVNAKRRA